MGANLFSYTGQTNPDPSSQVGMNQYIQQGQSQINPGQAQVAASSPVAAGGTALLAQALAKLGQQPALPAQLPPQISAQALDMGAQANPNVNGQNMGGVGPTQQNLALGQALMDGSGAQQPNPMQQFLNPPGQPAIQNYQNTSSGGGWSGGGSNG